MAVLLPTEHKGRAEKYWPKVVAVQTKNSKVCTKIARANIPQYGSSKLS